MIFYPRLKGQSSTRQVIDTFKGYNHNLRIGSGEFYEMKNLTSDDYPVLSVRKRRGLLDQSPYGCKGMYYVPGTGVFYVTLTEGQDVLYLKDCAGNIKYITDLQNTHDKKFALIGTYLVIAPDMAVVDIERLTSWKLGETWTVNNGDVDIQMCDSEGNIYENVIYDSVPPSAAGYHQLWMCTAAGDRGLRQYEPLTSQWVSIATTYLRINGLGDHRFEAGDGIRISGLSGAATHLNGSYVIQLISHGYIVIPGLIDRHFFQNCEESPITIEIEVPRLDFILECGNRLWGCKKDANEIYACKLGDMRNWNCFQGLSTDSWVGSVGTPGDFTGAAVQNGCPVFYKENCKHKVWPSATGAHQITSVDCEGVKMDCDNSVAVLDGTVFYKSPLGICADDGGGIIRIGEKLGDTLRYNYAFGAIFDGKYYLSVLDREKRHLLVYDIGKRLWHMEDAQSGKYLVSGDGSLYTISSNGLVDLTGNTGTPEEKVSWMAETGDLGLELPEQKYISRLTLRLMLEPGATLEVYAQYDREEVWVKLGQVYGTDLRSFSLPVRPRRCDQLRLKLQGTGMCKLYSITKTLEKGSELP